MFIKKIIKAIIILLIYYPALFLSFLVKRNDKWMCVGSAHGFRDNSKYFYLYENHISIRKFWITKNKNEATLLQNKKISAYYKWSIKGIYYTIRSKYHIYDYNINDINYWLSGNAITVNLWHGVGIKNIEYGITTGSTKKELFGLSYFFKKTLFPNQYKKDQYFLSTSEMMTTHFKKCFRLLDENIIKSYYPRCNFIQRNKIFIEQHINNYESDYIVSLNDFINDNTFNEIILYMPTWRDSGNDFFLESKINLIDLENILKAKNKLLLIKFHPNTKFQEQTISFDHIVFIPSKEDIYPIIPKTTTLITDYSSILYDYLLLKRKIILFIFDYHQYISNERDLAFDFKKNTIGSYANNFAELLYLIENDHAKINISDSYKLKHANLLYSFWGEHNNSLIHLIVNKNKHYIQKDNNPIC